MKKLMLMAAVAMTAAVVNAAACSWSISGSATASVKNGTAVWTTVGNSPVAYLILAADVTAVQTELSTKAAMDTSYAMATTSVFNNKGRFSNVEVDLPATSASYSMVLIYTDKEDANKIWYQFASTADAAAGSDDPTTPADPASFTATYFAADGWTSATASVPEPTSGILLLLGMAGLALRRKRA